MRTLVTLVFGLLLGHSLFSLAFQIPPGAEKQCLRLGGEWIDDPGGKWTFDPGWEGCEIPGWSEEKCDLHDGVHVDGRCRLQPSSFNKAPDSKNDCVALGGKWIIDKQGKYYAYSDCQYIPWSRSKCESNGGSWNSKTSCTIGSSRAYQIRECKTAGGDWDKLSKSCFFEKQRRECLDGGGKWERMGLGQAAGCVHYSEDGGRPCTSSSQCQFKKCMSVIRQVNPNDVVVGECARNDNPYSCFSYVENGSRVPGGCRD